MQPGDKTWPGADPLSWLLEPASSEQFLAAYFNKKHFLSRNPNRSRFKNLLSFEELDHILGTYGLKFPEIRLTQFERDLQPDEYTSGGDLIDPLRVGRLFAEGATVIYRGLQNRHQNVQLLCNALAQQASIQTQANIYLTPPHSQGFNTHWDTHDVFVIQIEGSKNWRIYDGGFPIPIKTHTYDSTRFQPGETIDEFTLEAGEVLYVPRGLIHAAESTSEPSLHITLGFLGYSWAELISDAIVVHAERSEAWRENLPFGYGNQTDKNLPELKALLAQKIKDFISNVDLEPFLDAHLWKVREASRPRASRFLANALNASNLEGFQVVKMPAGLSISIKEREDHVIIGAGTREISFPLNTRRMLEQLFDGSPISIDNLDDELDAESKVTVISKLVHEGMLLLEG